VRYRTFDHSFPFASGIPGTFRAPRTGYSNIRDDSFWLRKL
jgi:hypothetical protein